jgi:arginine/lysine/ornithine decarboxylase
MSSTAKKTLNRVKDNLKQRRDSPAQEDQSRSPVGDAIAAYWERDILTFSIPAHNGGRGPAPEFTKWTGMQTARADLPVTHGLDTRNTAYGIQETAQQLFAEAIGAQQVLFSTGGSSLSVRVAMMSVVGPGETIVMARNGHKSAFAGLIISGARPVYVEPYYDEELEVAHAPLAKDVAETLERHPEARGVMIFSPTYYGASADISAIADAAHSRDIPLISDDAWGLDYCFLEELDGVPPGALSQGADLAIGSVHKKLTGLSQTSVISVGSDRIDTERLTLCFELQESTSSSALLLVSIDGARVQFVREGAAMFRQAIATSELLRERLAREVPELPVISTEELGSRPGVIGTDCTHIMIETAAIGLSGYTAIDWIRDNHRIDVELIDHRRIMPLISSAHGEGDVERLVRALRALVDAHPDGDRDKLPRYPGRPQIRSEQAMLPRDAFFAQTETVKFKQAVGRISAELVTPYPPGIPAVAPGELYTQENVDYLQAFVEVGGFVEGAADPTLQELRVVKE